MLEYLEARTGVLGQCEAKLPSCPRTEEHQQSCVRLGLSGSGAAPGVQGTSCPPTSHAAQAGCCRLPAGTASCRRAWPDRAEGSFCSWQETTAAWRANDWRKKKKEKKKVVVHKKNSFFFFYFFKKKKTWFFVCLYAKHLLVHVQLQCQSLRFPWQIPAATCIKLVKLFFFFFFLSNQDKSADALLSLNWHWQWGTC